MATLHSHIRGDWMSVYLVTRIKTGKFQASSTFDTKFIGWRPESTTGEDKKYETTDDEESYLDRFSHIQNR